MSLVRFVLSSFWYNDIFKTPKSMKKVIMWQLPKLDVGRISRNMLERNITLLLVLPSFLVRFPMKELHMVYSII